jgi:hypothetical protein
VLDEPETQADECGSEVDDEADDDEPFRRDVNPEDRFSVSGKPLPLGDFVRSTMGELTDRERVEPEPQSEPQPFAAIWRARRPAPNPAEADWVEPPPDEADPPDA